MISDSNVNNQNGCQTTKIDEHKFIFFTYEDNNSQNMNIYFIGSTGGYEGTLVVRWFSDAVNTAQCSNVSLLQPTTLQVASNQVSVRHGSPTEPSVLYCLT